MEKSTSIQNIAKALMTFQATMGKLPKDAKNPFFKSSYCPLPTILSAIQEPLAECGLSFSQFPDGDHSLTTILMHSESGEYLQASYDMHPTKNDPQAIGSAITYSRRYALGAILGLNIDEDDDGNKGSERNQEKDDTSKQKDDDKRQWLNPGSAAWTEAVKYLLGNGTIEKIKSKYRLSKVNEEKLKSETMQIA